MFTLARKLKNPKVNIQIIKFKHIQIIKFISKLLNTKNILNIISALTLTAFTLISFLESSHRKKYEMTIQKSIKHLEDSTINLSSNYEIAITTYAFSLLPDNERVGGKKYLKQLKDRTKTDGNLMYWENKNDHSIEIQTAGYALMAILNFNEANSKIDASKIMNWLMTQKNGLDGFYSTTDTIIGLQALSKISKDVKKNTNIKVIVKPAGQNPQEILITDKTSTEIHEIQVSKEVDSLRLNLEGKGTVAGSLLVSFYSPLSSDNSENAIYNIFVQPMVAAKSKVLNLNIKISFNETPKQAQASMTIIEIKLPSGFAATSENEIKEFLLSECKVDVHVSFVAVLKN